MEIVLLAAFPIPLRLIIGLVALITLVLIAYWFFMSKNNPRSRSVDALPANNEARLLQDRYDKDEISEEDYRRKLKELEDSSKNP